MLVFGDFMSNKIKNYVVVDMDFDTGELLHQQGLYYSEAQLQAWDKYRQKMAALENGRANPFVWHSFTQGYETFDMLSSASIPRMFYMATFCGYDGMLVDGASNVLTKK